MPSVSTTSPSASRYHSLDGVRGFAMLLGIGLHAALPYIYNVLPWFVMDRHRSSVLTLIVFTVHAFRMPAFFLVAGFFARLLFVRLGFRGFWRHRLVRIGGPLVVAWLVLYPIMRAMWVWSAVWAQYPGSYARLVRGLATAFSVRYLDKGLSFLHLWFLYYLLVLYALVLVVRAVFVWLDRSGAGVRWLDRLTRRVFTSRGAVLILAVVTTPSLLLMRVWGVDLPERSLIPRGSHLLLYGLFTGAGWWIHRQPGLLRELKARWVWHAGVGLVALVPEIGMLFWIYSPEHHVVMGPGRVMFFFLYAVISWGGVLGLIGAFEALLPSENKAWRYMADASYWLYLVHLPAVVAVSLWLRPMDLSPWWKLAIVLLTTSPLLLISYHWLVRGTWLGGWLNGRRYAVRSVLGRR